MVAPPILGVALRTRDGTVLALPAPYRHHHLHWIYGDLYEFGFLGGHCAKVAGAEQGFVDDYGFLSRSEALEQALASGQLLPENKVGYKGDLFSEDIW